MLLDYQKLELIAAQSKKALRQDWQYSVAVNIISKLFGVKTIIRLANKI